MKINELKQIIREELKKVLKEEDVNPAAALSPEGQKLYSELKIAVAANDPMEGTSFMDLVRRVAPNVSIQEQYKVAKMVYGTLGKASSQIRSYFSQNLPPAPTQPLTPEKLKAQKAMEKGSLIGAFSHNAAGKKIFDKEKPENPNVFRGSPEGPLAGPGQTTRPRR